MIQKFDGKDFLQSKVSSIMTGKTEVRFESVDPNIHLMVAASSAGVDIGGKIASTLQELRQFEELCPEDFDLEEFARLIAEAWKVHLRMQPSLHPQKDVVL